MKNLENCSDERDSFQSRKPIWMERAFLSTLAITAGLHALPIVVGERELIIDAIHLIHADFMVALNESERDSFHDEILQSIDEDESNKINGEIFDFASTVERLGQGWMESDLLSARIAHDRVLKGAKLEEGYQNQLDYLLMKQGGYEIDSNSMIGAYIYGEGNCVARALKLGSEASVLYPDLREKGWIQVQSFNGVDVDSDGIFDTGAHVRLVVQINEEEQYVVEGDKARLEKIDSYDVQPSTRDIDSFLRLGSLEEAGLIIQQGTLSGAARESKYNSVFSSQGSDASYGIDTTSVLHEPSFFQRDSSYSVVYIPEDQIVEKKIYTWTDYQNGTSFEGYDSIDVAAYVAGLVHKDEEIMTLSHRLTGSVDISFEELSILSAEGTPKTSVSYASEYFSFSDLRALKLYHTEFGSDYYLESFHSITSVEAAQYVADNWEALRVRDLSDPDIARVLAQGQSLREIEVHWKPSVFSRGALFSLLNGEIDRIFFKSFPNNLLDPVVFSRLASGGLDNVRIDLKGPLNRVFLEVFVESGSTDLVLVEPSQISDLIDVLSKGGKTNIRLEYLYSMELVQQINESNLKQVTLERSPADENLIACVNQLKVDRVVLLDVTHFNEEKVNKLTKNHADTIYFPEHARPLVEGVVRNAAFYSGEKPNL